MMNIEPKEHHNYIAFFLSLSCNLKCNYCINLNDKISRSRQAKRTSLSVDDWIKAANRFKLRADLPLTLQGGEPTLYKDFYRFVNDVKEEIKMDLITNMMFDEEEFVRNVPVWRFTRKAPYAAIRVSYHPGQNNIDELIRKTMVMQDAGFRVGIYGIEYPDSVLRQSILEAMEKCLGIGLDFRIKEFLGVYNGNTYGTFKYANCVCSDTRRSCDCRTTEIIIDPSGYVFRCHSDLYAGREPIAHILDPDFTESTIDIFRHCNFYGDCNPCDVKVKTNRFQIFGHTSVEISNIANLSINQNRIQHELLNG